MNLKKSFFTYNRNFKSDKFHTKLVLNLLPYSFQSPSNYRPSLPSFLLGRFAFLILMFSFYQHLINCIYIQIHFTIIFITIITLITFITFITLIKFITLITFNVN